MNNKLQLNLKTEDLHVCHRLGYRGSVSHRPVIIKFNNPTVRQAVLEHRRLLKDTKTFISEDLTRARYNVFKRCRKKLNKENVWILNGNNYFKITGTDGKLHKNVIKNLEDAPKFSHIFGDIDI